jgi:hypothetical protein
MSGVLRNLYVTNRFVRNFNAGRILKGNGRRRENVFRSLGLLHPPLHCSLATRQASFHGLKATGVQGATISEGTQSCTLR